MTQPEKIVEAAQEKGTFSVLDAAKGISYPKEEVTVFQDIKSAYEIGILERSITDLGPEDSKIIARVEKQITALRKKVKESALVFHMTGLSPGVIEDIQTEGQSMFPNDDDGSGSALFINMSYVAASIQKVVDHEGNEDNHVWTRDEVIELRRTLPDESFDLLAQRMAAMSFAAAYFDASTDADFLSKS